MARFIVIVLDGFGVGAMHDVAQFRSQDLGANTALKLIKHFPLEHLPTLASLGLMNIVPCPTSVMKINNKATVGRVNLKHQGGDTFMGHQEIMGTNPQVPLTKPFMQSIDAIESALIQSGYKVRRVGTVLQLLLVNDCAMVGDNLEADLGQVYNVTGNLSEISFTDLIQIGKVVRSANSVGRNIVFGGELSSNQALIDAIETKLDTYIGVNAPKSGAYDQGFEVVHLGFGVDESVQVPLKLHRQGIHTTLVGKVADIVNNLHGTSYTGLVDTDQIMQQTIRSIQSSEQGFFCINVQETDLAGHQQDPKRYWSTLQKADKGIQTVIDNMREDDLLIVMADHGNDPFIGHSKHTREQVPLLVYGIGIKAIDLGTRSSLADVGASVCAFFNASEPESGHSFLDLIYNPKNE